MFKFIIFALSLSIQNFASPGPEESINSRFIFNNTTSIRIGIITNFSDGKAQNKYIIEPNELISFYRDDFTDCVKFFIPDVLNDFEIIEFPLVKMHFLSLKNENICCDLSVLNEHYIVKKITTINAPLRLAIKITVDYDQFLGTEYVEAYPKAHSHQKP